ncbi:MAG: divalent-cation tolerance protein CutA [Desulfobacterota bacterium]|nr:divalent-cation tolerance protein CutA [Thermodesulfobacteriota bacterium]
MEPILIFVTCGSEEEALKIARALVEDRLVACVNLLAPVRSIYRWEGRVWDEREWLLLMKTQRKRFAEVESKVKSLHSYSVPEIIGLSLTEGNPSYLNWLADMTEPGQEGG